jgi:hypothetical protein
MRSARIALLLTLSAAALAACGGRKQAVGTVSAVIVIASDSLWAAVGDSIVSALEPRIFTTRDERTFEVTHVSPATRTWTEMREFRQVLVLGTATDPWVRPVLERAGAADGVSGIVQATNVWARNQFATAVVLPATDASDAALGHVGRIAAVIDSTFRAYAVQRMFTSRADTLLRDSLRRAAGFSLLLPNVYTPVARGAGVSSFNNSTQLGGSLIRNILITSREGVLETTPAYALAWRDSVAAVEYQPGQRTERERVESRNVASGAGGVEIQGIWVGTDPSWPTSGPFIARLVTCPAQNRTYLLDAWLYAPSRAKYEYMIQLQTILDTFEC